MTAAELVDLLASKGVRFKIVYDDRIRAKKSGWCLLVAAYRALIPDPIPRENHEAAFCGKKLGIHPHDVENIMDAADGRRLTHPGVGKIRTLLMAKLVDGE